MPKITFLVNNNALSDTRVVKTAEALMAHGYACTVLGCDRSLTSLQRTTQNGVNYQIIPLRTAILRDLIAGYFPKWYAACINRQIKQQQRNTSAAAVTVANLASASQEPLANDSGNVIHAATAENLSTARVIINPADPTPVDTHPTPNLSLIKVIAKPLLGIARRGYRWLRLAVSLPRRYVVRRLQPRTSPMGAKALFGRYLRTFYPQLVQSSTDITYCHELWLLESSVLSKAADATVVVAYDSHELESHRHNDWTDAANATRTSYEEKYISSMHTVVTVCQSIAEHMQQDYNIELPLVVPNAPMNSRAIQIPDSNKLKRSLNLSDNPLLVYTGKVTTGRGLPTILKVLNRMPQVHLAIVGPRVATVASEIAAQATELGLASRVHFVDALAPEVLISAISDADVAVIPIENVCLSYYYSLPNKIFEAALAGVPALVSDFPELSRFVDRYGTGITVDFENIDAVVNKLTELLEQPKAYNSQDKAHRLRSELSFDYAMRAVSDRLLTFNNT